MTRYYPLGDLFAPDPRIRAKLTGEFRPPRKGEWYLSGAEPTAYRAANDLSTDFHILALVKVERIITYRELSD